MSGVRLRPYQQDCLKAIADAIAAGKRRMVVSIPTGGGKTVVFSHLIADLQLHQRALVLAHRDELILQTVDKIKMVTPKADIGIVKASENQYWTQTVVASVQTVANDRRLASLGRFDLVIVDECHHAVAESWTAILTALGAFEDDGPVVIGFTATPQRGDEVGLDTVFDEIVYDKPILELMDEQYLVDVRAAQVQVEGLDFSGIKRVAGDLPAGAAGRAMMNADAPGYVARAIQAYASERRSLVFTPTVMVAEAVAEAARAQGFAAASLDGKTASGERRRMIQDFHDGKLQVLANCAVLTEGTDIPPVDCVVIARPTASATLFQQMVGRGLRPYPGKEDCLVLDTVGATGRHKLVSVASLFGLDPKVLQKGVPVTEAARELARQQAIVSEATGKLIAIGTDVTGKARVHWIPSGDGKFLLSCGDGMLVLEPEAGGDRWIVTHQPSFKRPEVLASGLSLEFAQGVAEDRARSMGADVLIDPNASWRTQEPTERQLYRLAKLGVDLSQITTKGEASDAISAALSRRSA